MAGTCDICGGKTGLFNRFRCLDGEICKNCYGIVSNHYTTTVAGTSLAELKKIYIKNALPVSLGEDGFRTTRKISTFLLLDEENRKFCLTSNRQITGQYVRPEVFSYDQLERYTLVSTPALPMEQLSVLAKDKKSKTVIKKMVVRLQLQNAGARNIVIIPTPVRASSFAFRQGLKAAEEVLDALEQTKK